MSLHLADRGLSGVCLSLLFVTSMVGCSPGPRQLEQGHLAYNTSVKASVDDELLLNIIRLRYLDTVEFLAANSISSQTSYTVSIGAELGRNDIGPGVGTTALFAPRIEYSDRPTFTFAPQRGREFANSLTKPVDVRTLAYLAATNWDVYFLFRIFVREMNGLLNEIGNTEPAFVEAVRELGALQLQDALIFGFTDKSVPLSDPITASQISGADLVTAAQAGYRFEQVSADDAYVLTSTRSEPVLYFRPERGAGETVIKALGLKDDGRPYFELEPDNVPEPQVEAGAVINLRIRSLFDAIIYVTQGVEVPEAHVERGVATHDWPPGFDAQSIDDLLRIRASKDEPGVNWQVRYAANGSTSMKPTTRAS